MAIGQPTHKPTHPKTNIQSLIAFLVKKRGRKVIYKKHRTKMKIGILKKQ